MANVVVMLGVFNVENTIVKSLDSILSQDISNYRVIVSDNHSTDLSREILGSYSDRITLISPPSHLPAEDHWNFLLDYLEKLSAVDYAALYHGDDIYDANIVKSQVEFLDENGEAPMVFTDALIVNEEYSTIGWSYSRRKKFLSSKYTLEEVLYGMISATVTCLCPTAMMRLSILRNGKKYRFNPVMFSKAADYGLWLEIISDYDCVGILHRPLVKYRKSTSSDSAPVGISLEESPAFRNVRHYIGVDGNYRYGGWRWDAHIKRLLAQDYLRRLKNEVSQDIYPSKLIEPRLSLGYILISTSSLSGIYNFLNILFVKCVLNFVPWPWFRKKIIEFLLNQDFVVFTRRIRYFFSK